MTVHHIKKFLAYIKSHPEQVFYSFLVVFVIDNILNFFIDVPVFVPFAILMLPLLWINIWFNHPKKLFFIIYSLVFIGTALVSNILFGFSKKNISDLSFILLLVASYFYYQLNIQRNARHTVPVFFIVCTIMFSATFFSVDSMSWYINDRPMVEEIHQLELPEQKPAVMELPVLQTVSYFREYHNGLFRVPHVAGYFFGFLGLFFCNNFRKKRNLFSLIAGALSVAFMFYTGSRTFFVALMVALFLSLFKRKTLTFALVTIILLEFVLIFRYELFSLLKDTFLGPYAFLVVNSMDNYEGITRFVMLESWWNELREFPLLELFSGRTFFHTIAFNSSRHHIISWLHNDFTSITYAYGLAGLVLYVLFYVVVFIQNRRVIMHNIFIFLFFATMVVTALINGFYYYFPVFLLYLFLLMINEERELQLI
nr:hypothetical protein [Bacteroidota bacterium]